MQAVLGRVGGGETEETWNDATLQKLRPHKDCCYVVVKCSEMLRKLCGFLNGSFLFCSLNQFLREQRQKTSQWNYKGTWCFWLVLVPRKWYLHSRMPWAHKIALRESALCVFHMQGEDFNILPPQNRETEGGRKWICFTFESVQIIF